MYVSCCPNMHVTPTAWLQFLLPPAVSNKMASEAFPVHSLMSALGTPCSRKARLEHIDCPAPESRRNSSSTVLPSLIAALHAYVRDGTLCERTVRVAGRRTAGTAGQQATDREDGSHTESQRTGGAGRGMV